MVFHIFSTLGGKSLTRGALIFVIWAALSIHQAAVITLAHVGPIVLGTTTPFAACCWKKKVITKSYILMKCTDKMT